MTLEPDEIERCARKLCACDWAETDNDEREHLRTIVTELAAALPERTPDSVAKFMAWVDTCSARLTDLERRRI